MIALVVILILMLGFALFLALTTVSLRLDTYHHEYYVQIWGLVRCQIEWQEGPIFKIRVLFFNFSVDPLKPRDSKKTEQKKTGKPRDVSKKRRSKFRFAKVIRVLRTFRIREFRLELDTSDVIWNAMLLPVFYHLNMGRAQLNINYFGHSGLICHIENKAIRVLWALLRK